MKGGEGVAFSKKGWCLLSEEAWVKPYRACLYISQNWYIHSSCKRIICSCGGNKSHFVIMYASLTVTPHAPISLSFFKKCSWKKGALMVFWGWGDREGEKRKKREREGLWPNWMGTSPPPPACTSQILSAKNLIFPLSPSPFFSQSHSFSSAPFSSDILLSSRTAKFYI